jgi:hypothetical protein
LSLAVREQGKGPGAPAEERRDGRQASKVLPLLIGRLDPRRRITVLELGRAQPETIHFFSSFRCKIHVVDLYSELLAGRFDRSSSGVTLQRQFQQLFGFEKGTVLDVCLLWDLPHYLEEKLLRAFSSALWPWLQPASMAHAFGVHSAATVLLNREYGILDSNTISVRHRSGEQVKNSPHPQSFMQEWLTCFTTTSGVLLPDGKVETLMRATV